MPERDDGVRGALLIADIADEQDVFALRRYAKAAAEAAGMGRLDPVRLATALSELGRDLLGPTPLTAVFDVPEKDPDTLRVELIWRDDREPTPESHRAVTRLLGDANPRLVRAGDGRGGRVLLDCPLPPGDGVALRRRRIRDALAAAAGAAAGLAEGLRAQTRDLMAALEESNAQREELERLNRELEDTNKGVMALYTELSQELEETNRGVVALYAELEEKSRLLREAGESKMRFWSTISHELRTPINAVIGLSRLVLSPDSDPLTKEQHRQVSLVATAGTTLLVLVDELLDMAKAEAGRLQPHITRVDLAATCAQLRGVLVGTGHPGDVALVLPERTTPRYVDTDEVMLIRILRNLLSNALKFTVRGEVRLDVAALSGQGVQITVTDTGIGIPADELDRVFEEFHQVPGPLQRVRPGTGLGLAYARRLTEALGGTLTLHSTLGEGTRACLSLPFALEDDDGLVRPLAGIVVVDDDPVFHEVFGPLLHAVAERVVELTRGADVVEVVRRERPTGVVLDLQMPDTDGYAVLAELAADDELRDVPVVVLTASDPAEQNLGRLRHARGVLSKHGVSARRIVEILGSGSREGGPT
ncbi:ATP-binding response regulator [Streptodolium elevatio]